MLYVDRHHGLILIYRTHFEEWSCYIKRCSPRMSISLFYLLTEFVAQAPNSSELEKLWVASKTQASHVLASCKGLYAQQWLLLLLRQCGLTSPFSRVCQKQTLPTTCQASKGKWMDLSGQDIALQVLWRSSCLVICLSLQTLLPSPLGSCSRVQNRR